MTFDIKTFERKSTDFENKLTSDLIASSINHSFDEHKLERELNNALKSADRTEPNVIEKNLRAALKKHTRYVEGLVLKQYKATRKEQKAKQRKK